MMKKSILFSMFAFVLLAVSYVLLSTLFNQIHHNVVDMQVLRDPHHQHSITSVTQKDVAAQFSTQTHQGFSAGFTRDAFWFKLNLDGRVQSDTLILEIEPSYVDHLMLYWPTESGDYEQHAGGDLLPFSQREIASRNFVFALNNQHQPQVAYLSMSTHSSSMLVVKAWEPTHYVAKSQYDYFVFALFIGLGLSLLIFNLRSGLWKKDKTILSFLIYLAVFVYSLLAFNGFATQFFFKQTPFLDSQLVPITTLLLFISIYFIYYRMLQLSWKETPIVTGVASITMLSALVALVAVFFDRYVDIAPIVGLLVMATYLFWLVRGLKLVVNDYPYAHWLVLSTLSSLLGSITMILVLIGVLPVAEVGLYAFQIGSIIAVLSFQMVISGRTQDALENEQYLITEQITNQLKFEQEQHLRQQQSAFLAMLTHELKTPLSVIKMAISEIHSNGLLRQYARQSVIDINNIVERCSYTEKLEGDALSCDFINLNLHDFIAEWCRHHDAVRNIQLDNAIQTAKVAVDEVMLKTIVRNLIDNAEKYSPEHSNVRLTISDRHAHWRLSICNQLKNVVSLEQDKLFEKYYRAESAKKVSGSGLGLFLVKSLAERMNIQVDVEQHQDVFCVHLLFNKA